jgi:hypothetical protein
MPDGPQAVRSVVAVGAGFFAIQMLTLGGQKAFGGNSLPVTLVYMAVFECIGGYITARLAVIRPVVHAVALGLFTFVLSLVLAVLAWSSEPTWFQITALGLIVPMTMLGGKVRELQVRGR